jgi:hypothetical protein
MLAGATDDGVCLAEFVNRRMLPTQLERSAVASADPSSAVATVTRSAAQLTEYLQATAAPSTCRSSRRAALSSSELSGAACLEAGANVSYEELRSALEATAQRGGDGERGSGLGRDPLSSSTARAARRATTAAVAAEGGPRTRPGSRWTGQGLMSVPMAW